MLVIIQNIILGISLAAPIGPVNIVIIRRGLGKGFYSGFLVGIGAITADSLYLLLVYFGLSHLFTIPEVQIIIWTLGSLILFYLGYSSIKDFFDEIDIDYQNIRSTNDFIAGLLTNLSNPMTIVWWIGVFGATLTESISKAVTQTQAFFNNAAIVAGLLLWVFTVALLTNWSKKLLNEKSMGYISLLAGIALISFGIKFGYSAVVSFTAIF